MESLYALALMWSVGFPVESCYHEELDRLFLQNSENSDLLYLETEKDLKQAMLYILAHTKPESSCRDKLGAYLMERLGEHYSLEGAPAFAGKLYTIWQQLPDGISDEYPFLFMCYADDPLSWGDTEQCRSICEKMLRFYQTADQ